MDVARFWLKWVSADNEQDGAGEFTMKNIKAKKSRMEITQGNRVAEHATFAPKQTTTGQKKASQAAPRSGGDLYSKIADQVEKEELARLRQLAEASIFRRKLSL